MKQKPSASCGLCGQKMVDHGTMFEDDLRVDFVDPAVAAWLGGAMGFILGVVVMFFVIFIAMEKGIIT